MSTNLASLRETLDMSRVQLATAAKVSIETIQALEASSTSAWSVENLQREKVFAALERKARTSFQDVKRYELMADSPFSLHAANFEEKQKQATYQTKSRW